MTVFLVRYIDAGYESQIFGIYSTREKAEETAKRVEKNSNKKEDDGCVIEEYQIDPVLSDHDAKIY